MDPPGASEDLLGVPHVSTKYSNYGFLCSLTISLNEIRGPTLTLPSTPRHRGHSQGNDGTFTETGRSSPQRSLSSTVYKGHFSVYHLQNLKLPVHQRKR